MTAPGVLDPDQYSLSAATSTGFSSGRLANADLILGNTTTVAGATAFANQFQLSVAPGVDADVATVFDGLSFGVTSDGVFTGNHRFSTTSPVLNDFTAVLAGGVRDMLNDIADWLQRLADSALFDFDIPLAQPLVEDGAQVIDITTLGDVYDFGTAFTNDVLNRTLDGALTIDDTDKTAQTLTVVGTGGSYTLSFGARRPTASPPAPAPERSPRRLRH